MVDNFVMAHVRAVSSRLQPPPAVSGLKGASGSPPQTPPNLEKDPFTGTVTSIRFSHRHCLLQCVSWHCHFQHLSLSLPPSLPLSLSPPVSVSFPSAANARARVCVCVCVCVCADLCAHLHVHLHACVHVHLRARVAADVFQPSPAVSGRLQPSPAVFSRLQPSPALRERAALPPQTPLNLEKDPLTGIVTSIRFSHLTIS